MKTKNVLCLGFVSLLVATTAVHAQNPAEYIKWNNDGEKFYSAYEAWQPGKPLYQSAVADENFFISRVKPRTRFTNTATQVDPAITGEKDKNVLNWIPIGTTNNGNPNGLPSGIYDSDVFSMWNYITHYGNWTAPLIRVPGVFMDAAHKNGVSVSALASIPWSARISASDRSHGSNINALVSGGADKFIKFLKYYGVDGWGMNSEFSTTQSFASDIIEFMGNTYEKAITQGQLPTYSAAYYSLVGNNGTLSLNDGLTHNNKDWFHKNGKGVTNYFFGNYNWGTGHLNENDVIAKSFDRDPRDVYAGMDMQGRSYANWEALQNSGSSIGLWGAHNMNMFYESRNEKGSRPEVQQRTLQGRLERFYTNGHQNPARKLRVTNKLGFGYDNLSNFHGISAMASAKSVLSWDLGQMPFYSFFNLGNGHDFKIEGQQAYAHEWYNLGMQDYLPTWRYWFAPTLLGRNLTEATGLSATFVWDDAWFGGSSLQISGTTKTPAEYLHLFKTKFALQADDEITVRYKITSGSANVKFVASAEGEENTGIEVNLIKSDEIDLGVWKEAKIKVSSTGRNNLKIANKTLALIALKFENAQNLEIKLGELSIKRGTVAKPQAPSINGEYTKLLKRTFRGIDAKVIFSMATPAGHNAEEVVYNEDVKTSFFKVYIKQGDKQSFVTATTSWAALAFAAPFDPALGNTVQFGVSAVGLDGVTESDITWSNELTVEDNLLKLSDRVLIDKSVVKPNQEFTVKFEDPNQPATTWTVLKDGRPVLTKEGTSFTHQFAETGLYDVKVTPKNGTELTVPGLIQVSPEEVGAYPEIKTLTFNTKTEDLKAEINAVNALAYTGRKANGAVSRGLNLKESPMGINVRELWGDNVPNNGIPSYTLSFWVKFNSLVPGEDGINLLNIRQPSAPWPQNNWGHIWSEYKPNTQTYEVTHRGKSSHQKNLYKLDLKVGVWTHFAYVFERTSGDRVILRLYINGVRVPAFSHGPEHGHKSQGDNTLGFSYVNNLTSSYTIMFGGNIFKRAGVDGVMDDVKFYNKALTDADISKIVYDTNPFEGIEKDALLGFWDFEGNAESDFYFKSPTTNKKLGIGALKERPGEEGGADFVPFEPAFEAGSPFIAGKAFQITTKAKWSFPGGQINTDDETNTDTQGQATVTYKKAGTFSGKLTLENSWGKDERTIEGIVISDPQSVGDITDEVSLAAFPNPFVESVNVRFAAAGDYQIGIYDLSGRLVSQQVVSAEAGSIISVNLNAPAGLYLLRVQTTAGKLLQTIKLQKN